MVSPFKHEIREDEEIFHEARSHEEVLARVVRTPQVYAFMVEQEENKILFIQQLQRVIRDTQEKMDTDDIAQKERK